MLIPKETQLDSKSKEININSTKIEEAHKIYAKRVLAIKITAEIVYKMRIN